MGHDIRVPYDKHGSVSENSGAGKIFPSGPCCAFRGKLTPALVTCSKKGSITLDILKSAFERLDKSNIYKRTTTLKPFALFDAHDSRLQVPFLWYINNPLRPWILCIGLPNGTHKWQVRDINEHYLAKAIWLDQKNRKAISDRGWNPLNRRLLNNPESLKTRSVTTKNPPPIATIAPLLHTDVTPTVALATIEPPPAALATITTPYTIITPSDIIEPSTALATIEPPPTTLATTEPSAIIEFPTESITTATGCDNTMTSTIGMDVVPLPWIDLTDINVDRCLAGEFTIDILLGPIVGHEELPAVEAEFLDEMNM